MWGPVGSLELMRRLKDQFDPGRLMAPGRFAEGSECGRDPDEHVAH